MRPFLAVVAVVLVTALAVVGQIQACSAAAAALVVTPRQRPPPF